MPKVIEESVLKFWRENGILRKYLKLNRDSETFSFYDGPPTANNPMGVHHAWGRTLKDLYLRFKTMQGYNVRRQPGFDCQGLWVEVGVEKALGFNSKAEIEKYGVANFTLKCKETVLNYVEEWIGLSERLGMWMDWDSTYLTMSDNNIEHVWHFLKACHELDLLYQAGMVLPWCPRCGTSLSQHEVKIGYREVEHPELYLKFKDEKGRFLLVYTTTPWTLTGNVALAVKPDAKYVTVRVDGEQLVVSKARANIIEGGEIVEEYKGEELIGLKYSYPLKDVKALKDVDHRVVGWKLVDENEGTGIVHIAPGYGPEDYQLGREQGLPVVCLVDEAGILGEGAGSLKGLSVKKASLKIVEILDRLGLIYRLGRIIHRYPCCWRCHHELIYRVSREWFIRTSKLKDRLIEEAIKVFFRPESAGKAMLNWLSELKDWCISRKRYFGLPLPFWICRNGHLTVVGSREELVSIAVTGTGQLVELHRPWIDRVVVRCRVCGENAYRVKEVGDCWLDAGIVPFSTLKYLKDREYWAKWFPADFVTEMWEQVRLWFYAMLVMSVVLEGRAPYRRILAHGMVLDEKGREMHKSLGNVIWADEALEKMGADVVRWIYSRQNPSLPLKFGYEKASKVRARLNILHNLLNYVATYSEANNYKPDSKKPLSPEDPLNRWILSKLQGLIVEVTRSLEELRHEKAAALLEEFWVEDLSKWYIKLIRWRLKPAVAYKYKYETLQTLYHVTLQLLRLLSPFLPFLTEYHYQQFFKQYENRESIHFHRWPAPNQKLRSPELEEHMEIARNIVKTCNSLRAKAGLKARWPLPTIYFNSNQRVRQTITLLKQVILEGCNAKKLSIGEPLNKGFLKEEFEHGTLYIPRRLTNEAKIEAAVRELARRIQVERKRKNLKVGEKVKLWISTPNTIEKDIRKFEEYLKAATDADIIKLGTFDDGVEVEALGIKMRFKFEK